jgi:hypothetical protein
MKPRIAARAFGATVRLLYDASPWTTVGTTLVSLLDAAAYPLLLLAVAELLHAVLDPSSVTSGSALLLALALGGLVLAQATFGVLRDVLGSMLRAEASLAVIRVRHRIERAV